MNNSVEVVAKLNYYTTIFDTNIRAWTGNMFAIVNVVLVRIVVSVLYKLQFIF